MLPWCWLIASSDDKCSRCLDSCNPITLHFITGILGKDCHSRQANDRRRGTLRVHDPALSALASLEAIVSAALSAIIHIGPFLRPNTDGAAAGNSDPHAYPRSTWPRLRWWLAQPFHLWSSIAPGGPHQAFPIEPEEYVLALITSPPAVSADSEFLPDPAASSECRRHLAASSFKPPWWRNQEEWIMKQNFHKIYITLFQHLVVVKLIILGTISQHFVWLTLLTKLIISILSVCQRHQSMRDLVCPCHATQKSEVAIHLSGKSLQWKGFLSWPLDSSWCLRRVWDGKWVCCRAFRRCLFRKATVELEK